MHREDLPPTGTFGGQTRRQGEDTLTKQRCFAKTLAEQEVTSVDIDAYTEADSLMSALRAKGLNPPVGVTRGKLIDWMLSEVRC